VLCPKCSAEVPEGSSLCSQCGAQLAPGAAEPEIKARPAKLGLPLLPLLGAAALGVGPFLSWASVEMGGALQGLQVWPPASALYVLGALAFIVTLLAKGDEHRLSAALTFIGALSLALVFHFVYFVFDQGVTWGNVREGFYVTGVGAFFTALAGCPLFRQIMV